MQPRPATAEPTWWGDACGVGLSAFCLAHCLAMPAMLTLLPTIESTALRTSLVHRLLAMLVILVAAGFLVPGYVQHRRHGLLMVSALGVALITLTSFGPLAAPGWGGWSLAVRVVASLLLVAAHLGNQLHLRRLARGRCPCRRHPALQLERAVV